MEFFCGMVKVIDDTVGHMKSDRMDKLLCIEQMFTQTEHFLPINVRQKIMSFVPYQSFLEYADDEIQGDEETDEFDALCYEPGESERMQQRAIEQLDEVRKARPKI